MMGIGLGYPSLGMMGEIDSQYAFRDEDEALWKIEDIELAINECIIAISELKVKIQNAKNLDSIEKKQMNQFIAQMSLDFLPPVKKSIEVYKKLSDSEKQKLWPLIQGEYVQTSKLCLSLKDTYNLDIKPNLDNQAFKNYYCYYQNLTILENGPTLMMKDLVREGMFTPGGTAMLGTQFYTAFNPFKMTSLNLFNNGGQASASAYEPVEHESTYCPNKTAEMIEDVIKNNPCITKVNVPDKWLLNRLNELGDKVIFKPFADDDRFSFEMEKTVCK
jgi:hypothetical protein